MTTNTMDNHRLRIDMSVALTMIVRDADTRRYLKEHHPQALKMAEKALDDEYTALTHWLTECPA